MNVYEWRKGLIIALYVNQITLLSRNGLLHGRNGLYLDYVYLRSRLNLSRIVDRYILVMGKRTALISGMSHNKQSTLVILVCLLLLYCVGDES